MMVRKTNFTSVHLNLSKTLYGTGDNSLFCKIEYNLFYYLFYLHIKGFVIEVISESSLTQATRD